MKSAPANTQKVLINLTQICAFQATEDEKDNILKALTKQGYHLFHINTDVLNDQIDLPLGENSIRYQYEPNLYGDGLGALDFVGGIDQGARPVKLAELISEHSSQRIHSTEQYVGDHGIAVEVTICLKGNVLHRYNSDETFDNSKNYH